MRQSKFAVLVFCYLAVAFLLLIAFEFFRAWWMLVAGGGMVALLLAFVLANNAIALVMRLLGRPGGPTPLRTRRVVEHREGVE